MNVHTVVVLAVSIAVTACGDASDPAPGGPTAESSPSEAAAILPDPVEIEDAVLPFRMHMYSRVGYWTSDGRLMIDVLEGDLVYATLMVTDAEGRPVRGARPTVTPLRESRYVPISGEPAVTGELGNYRFGLVGGTMGEEWVEIGVGDDAVAMILNVISQRASGYDWLGDVEGVLDWRLLMQAEVTWGDEGVSATFPEEVVAQTGETVKLVGFAMPLEATLEQKHFLLTSSPPGCFFHIPGGAAGAVEVFSAKPLPLGFDPVVLEGRFEALENSDVGVVYRLHEARAIDLDRDPPGE